MLDTNFDPSLVANPGSFEQNFHFNELFPSTVDANCNSMMSTNYDSIGNDLTETTQFNPTAYALESDDSINNSLGAAHKNFANYTSSNSQPDPITGAEAVTGSQDSLMLESGESGIQLPDTTGSYSVGTTNYEWVDPMRDETYTEDPTDKRELTAKVWYPTEKVAEGNTAPYIDNEEVIASIAEQAAPNLGIPVEQAVSSLSSLKTNSIAEAPIAQTESDYPVIVFSPGAGGSAEDSTAQAEELASQGYVVVGINHTYDTLATGFSDGRIVEASPKLDDLSPEVLNESIDIRAADARFVLDQLELINTSDPQGILTEHLDLEHVGILGYSLGGATAIEVLAQDSRFDAGINMDGNLFKAEARAGSLTQPFMYLNNQVGIAQTPSRQTFYESLPNDAYNVTIDGTAHTSFSDLPFLVDSETLNSLADSDSITPIDPERGTTIINDYNVAFFDKYLKNEEESLLEAPSSDYPEVTFESNQEN